MFARRSHQFYTKNLFLWVLWFGLFYGVCLLCGYGSAEDGRRRALREREAELHRLWSASRKGLLDDAQRLRVIVCLVECRHLLAELRDDGRGRDILERLLGLAAPVAARRRAPALRLEVLLRADGEVELLLTLDTGQALRLQLLGTTGDTALRLPPSLLGKEGLVGGRELELGLTLQAREHEARSLLGGAALLARLWLSEIQRAEEVGLVLCKEEGGITGAAGQLLAVVDRLLGNLRRGGLGGLGGTDGTRLALGVEALELHLQLWRAACGGNLFLVRLDELLDGERPSQRSCLGDRIQLC